MSGCYCGEFDIVAPSCGLQPGTYKCRETIYCRDGETVLEAMARGVKEGTIVYTPPSTGNSDA